MKILFINPGIYDRQRKLIKQKRVWLPGLTLPHLAALTPPDIEVRIVDEISAEVPEDDHWDLVAVSSMGTGIVRAWELGNHFRSMGIPVVLGGVAATLGGPETSRAHCDAIVLGEAENIWLELLEDARRRHLRPVYHGPPADLSRLPIPRYDLLERDKIGFWLPLQTTRGCQNRCRFCSVASFHHGTYRVRPLDQIQRDIEAIRNRGYSKIAIIDDSIGLDLGFLKDLCRLLIPYKIQWMSQCTLTIAQHDDVLDLMAQSGCAVLSVGLESLDQMNLNALQKPFNRADRYLADIRKIRSYGIDVSTEMMVGLDADTDEVFQTIFAFIMSCRISVPRIFIVTPIPGTPLYDEWRAAGRIFDHDILHYSGSQLVFYPKGMSVDGLEKNYWQTYRRLFTLPAIARRFWGSRPTRGFLVNLFLFAGNFHYRKHIQRQIPPGIV